MTGRYPPAHGARHNGMAMDPARADAGRHASKAAGFATAAFVAAFPLDRRFGLTAASRPTAIACRGDRTAARPTSGRAGRWWTRRIAWLDATPIARGSSCGSTSSSRTRRTAPPTIAGRRRRATTTTSPRPIDRSAACSRRSARAGRDAGRGDGRSRRGVRRARRDRPQPVRLRHDAAGAAGRRRAGRARRRRRRAGQPGRRDAHGAGQAGRAGARPGDGVDLSPLLQGGQPGRPRALRRVVRAAARLRLEPAARRCGPRAGSTSPRRGPSSTTWPPIPARPRNLAAETPDVSRRLAAAVERISPSTLTPSAVDDRKPPASAAGARLRRRRPASAAATLADPKDRRELAAAHRPGDLRRGCGPALERDAARHPGEDPGNPQAHLRLGDVLAGSNRCREATAHFTRGDRRPACRPPTRTSGWPDAWRRRGDSTRRRKRWRPDSGSSPTTRW